MSLVEEGLVDSNENTGKRDIKYHTLLKSVTFSIKIDQKDYDPHFQRTDSNGL